MQSTRLERRRSVRVCPPDSVVLFDDPPLGAMPIIDVSAGGVLVQGVAVRELGRRVRLILLLPDNRRILVHGRIEHATSNGQEPAFAVRFEKVDSDALRSLSLTVSLELKRQLSGGRATALVVDQSKTVCSFVRASLDEVGAVSRSARTVLDAIQELLHGEIAAVFVGDPAGSSNALELAHFVRRQYPNARLVLLVEAVPRRDPAPSERDARCAVTLLDKPWTPARLAGFLLEAPAAPVPAAEVG